MVICLKTLQHALSDISKLAERIRFHYQKQTSIEKFMETRRAEIQNFELIPYETVLKIPENDLDLDRLAQHVGLEMVNHKFSHFIYSLKKVPCKTAKTTLDEMTETLGQTHDNYAIWALM